MQQEMRQQDMMQRGGMRRQDVDMRRPSMMRHDVDMRRPSMMRPDMDALDDDVNVITRERTTSITCDKGCQTVSKNRARRTKSTSDKQDHTPADKPQPQGKG